MGESGNIELLSGPRRCGPSFIFIGSSKAGSSWFFEILGEHPEVFVPPNKATFYFSDHYSENVQWYESFFTKGLNSRARGEVCHDYLASPDALQRIRNYCPGMRLICCLRNPYERALSSWRFYGRNGVDEPTLAAQGAINPKVFEDGYYATHLESLTSIFPKEQVCIYFFEELARRPEAVVRRLYEFIGVDPNFQPPSLRKRINVNARPRSRALARFAQFVHVQSWKRSRHLSNTIGRMKRFKPLRRLVRATLYKEPVRSTDWREHLNEFPAEVMERYEREITALQVMLKQDLAAWRAPVGCQTDYIEPQLKASEKSEDQVFDGKPSALMRLAT